MGVTAAKTEQLAFERIVVPLDGSELSDRIVAQVRRILVRKDAKVTLVRVIPQDALRDAGGADAVEAATRHLDALVRSLRGEGATVDSEVLVGSPAERILELATERKASLIAMATHGRSGIARFLRGSVAERMLRASNVPLLLANPFGLDERAEARFRRILVPLDLSARSAEILPLVKEVAALYESEVILMNVITIPAPLEYPVSYERASGADAEAKLGEYAKTLEGLKVFTATEVGAAAWSILEKVEKDGVDLVAMTTHGHTGAARWAWGSVAEHVIRSVPCPLLVKRTVSGETR